MASEETPLLHDEVSARGREHEAVYDRFSPIQKRTILFLVSLAGLSPLVISESFIPSVPQIARDLHTSSSVINFAIGLSIFSNALGSLFWATYSSFYGRRPIYLVSFFLQCVGSLGVATAQSVPQLLLWRILQAFGSSSGHSVGMGVISDIYRVEERGTASGIFLAAVLLGPVFAPLIGGLVAYYYSWRAMQYGILMFAVLTFVLTYLLQPETSQPGSRGVDRMIASKGKASWVWLNPLSGLALLRSPNVSLLALAGAFNLLTDVFILIPIYATIGARYGITNEALVGALCLPVGAGNFLGAPMAGWLSDKLVIKWRKLRENEWVPEDRLRATIPGAAFMVPMSILVCGFVIHYTDSRAGLIIVCVCMLLNGVGIDFVLAPSTAYNVDILHDRSAEVTAANMAFRHTCMAFAAVAVLPLINALGVLTVYSVAAVMAWIGAGIIMTIIRHGVKMRAHVDLGFSTAENN